MEILALITTLSAMALLFLFYFFFFQGQLSVSGTDANGCLLYFMFVYSGQQSKSNHIFILTSTLHLSSFVCDRRSLACSYFFQIKLRLYFTISWLIEMFCVLK